jgi:uncharacterized membrane protein
MTRVEMLTTQAAADPTSRELGKGRQLARSLDAAAEWADARPGVVLAILTAVYFPVCFARSAVKPLWSDELFTLYLTGMPTSRDMLAALRQGVDAVPPLFFLLTRPFVSAFGERALSIRLPEMIGFWIGVAVLFGTLQRRLSTLWVSVAVLLLCLGGAFGYAIEGRPYGLVLGCTGVAVAAWLRISRDGASSPRAVSLGLALGLATALHYFSVFLIIPLGVGELLRSRRVGGADWRVWAALATPFLALALNVPFMLAAMSYSKGFWSTGGATSFVMTYDSFLGPELWWITGAVLLMASLRRLCGTDGERDSQDLPPGEWAMLILLALTPLFAVALAKIATHVYTDRYVVFACVGLAVALAAVGASSSRSRRDGLVVFVWFLAAFAASPLVQAIVERRGLSRTTPLSVQYANARQLVTGPLQQKEIVLVGSQALYLELFAQLPPELRQSMVTTVSPALALSYTGTNTADLNLAKIEKIAGLRILDTQQTRGIGTFYLLYDPGFSFAWVPQWLLDSGAVLRFVGHAGSLQLYQGTWPGNLDSVDSALWKLPEASAGRHRPLVP